MPLTKEQLEARKDSIGSSDAAAVLGKSRYKTPLSLWAEKTGQVEPEDISDKLPIIVGNELEDLVAKLFMQKTGLEVRRAKETRVDKKYDFLTANLDRLIVGTDEILECKTASSWKASEWDEDEIPQEYIIQCLHALMVTGKKRAHIAVLIGGNQAFLYKVIERDEEVIAEIRRREVEFWMKFVVPKEMPAIVTKNDGDILFKLFPEGADEEALEFGDDVNRLFEEREAVYADLGVCKGNYDRINNELKKLLKEHSIGVTDKWKATWKEQTSRRINPDLVRAKLGDDVDSVIKATTGRVLRVSKIKAKKTKAAKKPAKKAKKQTPVGEGL